MPLSSEDHTVKRYDQELKKLRDIVLEMGGIAEDQIDRAIESLEDENLELARAVIVRDEVINNLEINADDTAIDLIALRQPMGSDLRMVIALIATVTDLERVGDEAERIARMVVHIYDSDMPTPNRVMLRDISRMAKLASALLRDSLDALARLDLPKAIATTQGDETLDQEFQDALRRLVTYVMEDPRNVGHTINITFILKSLERIGDHAVNISENVIYLIKGKNVRHVNRERLDQDFLD
jgi:phosphate transport system protein